MDKIVKYQQAILELLHEYAEYYKGSNSPTKYYVIADKENHHYLLNEIGFSNRHFVNSTIFHFDIINGKVWLQANNTKHLIADELIEKGVPKNEIVLGFHEPHLRQYTGFAACPDSSVIA
jgi:hypothetical protein